MRTTIMALAPMGNQPGRDALTVSHPDAMAELDARLAASSVDMQGIRVREARERFAKDIRGLRLGTHGDVLEPHVVELAIKDAMAEALGRGPNG